MSDDLEVYELKTIPVTTLTVDYVALFARLKRGPFKLHVEDATLRSIVGYAARNDLAFNYKTIRPGLVKVYSKTREARTVTIRRSLRTPGYYTVKGDKHAAGVHVSQALYTGVDALELVGLSALEIGQVASVITKPTNKQAAAVSQINKNAGRQVLKYLEGSLTLIEGEET